MPSGCHVLPRRRWTEEEDEALKRMHPLTDNAEIARTLNRTVEAIGLRAVHLGLSRSREQISIQRSKMNLKGLPRVAGLSDAESAYLAGIIDGEGTITVAFTRGYTLNWAVTVSNTSKVLMDWIESRVGGTVHARKKFDRTRECFSWRIGGNNRVRIFLEKVLPFLVIKRAQAELAMKPHYAMPPEERQVLVAEVRRLNSNNRWSHLPAGANTEGGRSPWYGRRPGRPKHEPTE